MNTKVKQAIIDHAKTLPNEEVCGFIYYTQDSVHAYPCTNVSPEGTVRAFQIDPHEYIQVSQLGKIVGVYHSHPIGGAPGFSEEDLEVAREMCLPFYLYAVEQDKWSSYIPLSYTVNPVSLPFIWGQWDCLEVIRTHYRQTKGVYMTDYDRDESFQGATEDAITKHIADEGFYEVPGKGPIKVDDVLLFKTIGTAYPHHLGVFMGQGRVLHHPLNMLSRIDPLTGPWIKRISMVLRYGGKKDS